MSKRHLYLFPALLALAACDASQPAEPAITPVLAAAKQVVGHVTGEGSINVGVPMFFDMTALLRADGSATGEAYHFASLGATFIEFRTRVTCVSFDPVNNRAWVGGVITENTSTDPARMQPRNEVAVDRGTFLGFTGDAGFETSADYCAGQPWPGPNDDPPQAVDARTGPLLSGNISVKP